MISFEELRELGIVLDGDPFISITSIRDFLDWLSVQGRFAPRFVPDWKQKIIKLR